MATKTSRAHEINLLRRLIRPQEKLPSPAAEYFLTLKFDAKDQSRMHELARKASAGTLTFAEQREADLFEFLGQFLTVLHLKANISLKNEKTSA